MTSHHLIIGRNGTMPCAKCSCGEWEYNGYPALQELSDRHLMHAEEAAAALNPITDEQAQAIEARLSAVSPGPWELEPEGRKYIIGNKEHQLATDVEYSDAKFFLHAPADIRALLDDRELADAAIARLNKRVTDDLANADTLMRERYAYKQEAQQAGAQVQAIRDAVSAWDLTDDEIAMFCNDTDPYQRARLWTIYQTKKAIASEIRRRLLEAATEGDEA
ncbi:hypothetical protein [Glycomyces sp. NPDC021274]|uniref:hypothetical protein n=1 Tax=Glycomyces sp. NPDC021274 TaxID=3155120 RepID=UPI00340E92F2